MIRALLLLALWPSFVAAQLPEEFGGRWRVFQGLTGKWGGTGTGEWGDSKVDLNCQYILNSRFLELRTRTTYLGPQKSSAGAVLEELTIVSFDRDRNTFILRQFQGRGLVLHGVLDSISADGKTMQFTSEALENASPGWRATVTYRLISQHELVYSFEFAPPGKSFEPHSEFTLKRTQ